MTPTTPRRDVPLSAPALEGLRRRIEACHACPRLVRYRESTAREGERRTGERHWGRPLAGFGDPEARLVIVGLAPAARGGNRTGRVFTGDRSAEFLAAGLYRAGFANQPTSISRDDGLAYRDAFVTAAVRCAPPENRPSPAETRRCRPFLQDELRELRRARVLLALGAFAWDQLRAAVPEVYGCPRPRIGFGHGARTELGPGLPSLWGSYHPSPRNVQTGLFTAGMFDRQLREVRSELEG